MSYIACICEGAAEQAVIDLDLDGKDVSNKIENGKQKGRRGPEYEAITHFYNIK